MFFLYLQNYNLAFVVAPQAIIIDCDEDDTDDVMEVVPLKVRAVLL